MTRHGGVMTGLVLAGALWLAGTAQATPFFEVMGGREEVQNYTGSRPKVIPNGALGWDNPAYNDVIYIYVRDTSAPVGTPVEITFNYVGSDAVFTNEFQNAAIDMPAGDIRWCNKSSSVDCTGSPPLPPSVPIPTPVGTGNLDWFGNYAATATMMAQVGDLVSFAFIGACAVCGPPFPPDRFVVNGMPAPGSDAANPDDPLAAFAHMGVYNITGGAFNFTSRNRLAEVLALGLSDDALPGDDDHQDFMVAMSVSVPEPGASVLAGLALAGLAVLRRRVRP